MRIVGGTYRGKKLALPEDGHIRPTADRTREALFNILGHGSEYRTDEGPLPIGVRVLDIFSGTGALGMEAFSRGATHITFIDNHVGGLKLVKQNISAFDAGRSADMLLRDGTKPGKAGNSVDLVLMDPPYNKSLAEPALEGLVEGGWTHTGTICVVELAAKEKFDCPSSFELLDERKYGAARLVFLKAL